MCLKLREYSDPDGHTVIIYSVIMAAIRAAHSHAEESLEIKKQMREAILGYWYVLYHYQYCHYELVVYMNKRRDLFWGKILTHI